MATCEELNSWSTCLAPFIHPSPVRSNLRLHSGPSVSSDRTQAEVQSLILPPCLLWTRQPAGSGRCGAQSCSSHHGDRWKNPEATPRAEGSTRAGERRGTAGGRVELEMTCCWSHAASEKENALDGRAKLFAAGSLEDAGGKPADQRRLKVKIHASSSL